MYDSQSPNSPRSFLYNTRYAVILCDFVVGTVSADELAPLGGSSSAGTVMTYVPRVYTEPALKGIWLHDWGPEEEAPTLVTT